MFMNGHVLVLCGVRYTSTNQIRMTTNILSAKINIITSHNHKSLGKQSQNRKWIQRGKDPHQYKDQYKEEKLINTKKRVSSISLIQRGKGSHQYKEEKGLINIKRKRVSSIQRGKGSHQYKEEKGLINIINTKRKRVSSIQRGKGSHQYRGKGSHQYKEEKGLIDTKRKRVSSI